ncbi:hypothetical protein D1872_313370 [compost metagenome]
MPVILDASRNFFEPIYWATTIAAPLPITSRIRMAIEIIWLDAPIPDTALSDTELIISVSTVPISINKNTSKKIGQVNANRFIDLPCCGVPVSVTAALMMSPL